MATCRGTSLAPGRYACIEHSYWLDYICVVDVRETAKSFILKIDMRASTELWMEMRGASLDEFTENEQEEWIEMRKLAFAGWSLFKNGGKLRINKDGTKHPIYVESETCFLLNPYWGGRCYEFNRM